MHNVTAPDGQTHKMFIRMGAFLADMQEAWMITCIRQNGNMPDIRTLAVKGQLNDTATVFAQRTEASHEAALQRYDNEMATSGIKQKAMQHLDNLSIHPEKVRADAHTVPWHSHGQ
jgi:hypothetical protein